MQSKIDSAIKKFLLRLCTIHNRKYDEGLEAIWLDDLSHLSAEEIIMGITRMKTEYKSSYMPTPAIFLELATATTDDDINVEAEATWTLIVNTMKKYGRMKTIAWENPICAQWIKEDGGWAQLCLTEIENLTWKKKAFLKAYPALRKYKEKCETITHERNDDPMVFVGQFTEEQKKLALIEHTQKHELIKIPNLRLVK